MSEIKKYRLREVVEAWQFNINEFRELPKTLREEGMVGQLTDYCLYLLRKPTDDYANNYLALLNDGDYVILKNGKFHYRAAKEDWEEQFEEVVSVQIHNGDKSLEDYVSKNDIDNFVGETLKGGLKLDKTVMPTKLGDLDLSDMPTHPLTDEEEPDMKDDMVHSLIINLTEKEQFIFREVDGDLTYEQMDGVQIDFMSGEDNIFFAAKGEEYVFSREHIKNILILEGTYACFDR